MIRDKIKEIVRDHIAVEFLHGEDADQIADDTRLISDGILDSLATLRLVAFIEERFNVKIEAHEVDVDHLETLDAIADMVIGKQTS